MSTTAASAWAESIARWSGVLPAAEQINCKIYDTAAMRTNTIRRVDARLVWGLGRLEEKANKAH